MNPRITFIENLITHDPGGRHIIELLQIDQLQLAAQSLRSSKRVGLVTGFYISQARAGETDGPPGAKAIGDALGKLGITVDYLTDMPNAPLLRAMGIEPIVQHETYLDRCKPTHLIAVERPGRCVDGTYRNIKGLDISATTSPLDQLFIDAAELGITTVGIGDGGNEIGMGNVFAQTLQNIPNGEKLASVISTDFCIVAGVSNWGALGLVGALSILEGKDLMPSAASLIDDMKRLVADGGAVDGVTHKHEQTIDGLPISDSLEMAEKIRRHIAPSPLVEYQHRPPVNAANMTPQQVRTACRVGTFDRPTTNAAPGFVQANLVVLPAGYATAFESFCNRNPKPCPLLEIVPAGSYEPTRTAPLADLRTDLPRYRIYKDGKLHQQANHLLDIWQHDFVSFLIGCSFTFDRALLEAGVPVRHIELERNVPMYRTNIACKPAGPFHGPLVVSMRPMTNEHANIATDLTANMKLVHGEPIQIGRPEMLGIVDIHKPDYGDAVPILDGEQPVFWACGVTPFEAIARAKPTIAITHEPGHMFITDWPDRKIH